MEPIKLESAPSLSNLSTDILLEIIDCLAQGRRGDPRSRPLKHLSRTNRRFRTLIRPLLLSSIALAKVWKAVCPDDAWDHTSAFTKRLPTYFPLAGVTKVTAYFPDLSYYLQPIVAEAAAKFLASLPNLAYVDLTIQDAHLWYDFPDQMDICLAKDPLAFRSVKTLLTSQSCMFLLRYFSETQRLVWSDSSQSHMIGMFSNVPPGKYLRVVKFLEATEHVVAEDGRRYPKFNQLEKMDDVRRVFRDVIGTYALGYTRETDHTAGGWWVLAESGEDGLYVRSGL